MEFPYQEKCNHNFTTDIVQDVYFSRGKQIKFNHLHLNIRLEITKYSARMGLGIFISCVISRNFVL